MCCNKIIMERISNIKNKEVGAQLDRFKPKTNLNLNDLLKKRIEEKKVDKKNNLLIISFVITVGAVVALILSI